MIGAKELSPKNPWYIPKLRYLELKNYCLQYYEWGEAYTDILNQVRSSHSYQLTNCTNDIHRTVESTMALAGWYYDQMRLVRRCIRKVCGKNQLLTRLIFAGVTENKSYDSQVAADPDLCVIPRNVYYDEYRKFFYILDKDKKEAPYVRS